MGEIIEFPEHRTRKPLIRRTHPDNKVDLFDSAGELWNSAERQLGLRAAKELDKRTHEETRIRGKFVVSAVATLAVVTGITYFGSQNNQREAITTPAAETEYDCDISDETRTWTPGEQEGWDHALLDAEVVAGNIQKGDFCYNVVISGLTEQYGSPDFGTEYQVPTEVIITPTE